MRAMSKLQIKPLKFTRALLRHHFLLFSVTYKGCKDHSSSCEDLAKNGECMEKPVFMFAFCRWSCKQCAKSSSKLSHNILMSF